MTDRQTRRRWLTLSLRGMIALILAVAVGLGWWVNSVRRQETVVRTILASGVASVVYGDKNRRVWTVTDAPSFAHPPDHWWWPHQRLERLLGTDFLHTVTAVDSRYGQGMNPAAWANLLRAVADLSSLEELILLRGPVTNDDAAALRHLGSLRYLNLASDSSKLGDAGLRSLSQLRNLERLTIRGNFSPAGLAAIDHLIRLETLNLGILRQHIPEAAAPTADHGSPAWSHLTSLQSLKLIDPYLDRPTLRLVGSLANLEQLNLHGGVYIDDDIQALATLGQLKQLILTSNHRLDGTGLRHLAGLPHLDSIALLVSPKIGDAALPSLATIRSLQNLTFIDTNITADGLAESPWLSRLTRIELLPSKPADRARLRAALPGCRITPDDSPNSGGGSAP